MRRRSDFLIVLAAAGSLTCRDATVPATARVAASWTFLTPPSSTIQDDVTFSPAVELQLLDSAGHPLHVCCVLVAPHVTGPRVDTGFTNTNELGIARISALAIHGKVGTYDLRFVSPQFSSVLSASVTVTPGNATNLIAGGGDNQPGQPGAQLATPPTVIALDADSNAVPGVPVNFAITGGGGSITSASAITDASGRATVGWTLGAAEGENTLDATISGPTLIRKTFWAYGGTTYAVPLTICSDSNHYVGTNWMAYKNELGSWHPVTIANDTVTLHVTKKFAWAHVRYGGLTEMRFITVADTQGMSLPCDASPSGGNHVHGAVRNIPDGRAVDVTMGSAASYLEFPSNFDLVVTPGPHDLLATEGPLNDEQYYGPVVLDRFILRRQLKPADGSTIQALDFAGSEVRAPARYTLTVAGSHSDTVWATGYFGTPTMGIRPIFARVPVTQGLYGIPSSVLTAGDVQGVEVEDDGRVTTLYFRDATDRTLTMGPALNAPNTTTIATSPYLRLRTHLARQGAYDDHVDVTYFGGVDGPEGANNGREIHVHMTAGYVGSAQYWDIEFPEWSQVIGLDPHWMFSASQGASGQLSATNWRANRQPVAGDVKMSAQAGLVFH